MPNWNYTSVYATGPKKQIDDLYSIMDSMVNSDKPRVENGFGNTWYGCLLDAIGLNWKDYRCRGSWQDLSRVDDNTLHWNDETAWGPLLGMFEAIKKHFPDLRIYWLCEEPGMCIYESNDIDHLFFNTMYVLYYDQCEYTEYFESTKELLDFVNNWLNTKDEPIHKHFNSLKELDEFVEESDELVYYTYEYTY